MKVSKVVKEAINSSIQNKADNKINELKSQQDLEQEPLKALEIDFNTCIYRAVIDWFEQVEKTHPRLKFRSTEYRDNFGIVTFSRAKEIIRNNRPAFRSMGVEFTTPEIEKLDKEILAIKKQVKAKTDEIVLALELGDKKQTIQDLLDQVTF